ncbi:uncharacterized protein LOC116290940 isoform X1 [Actinia tenebrosa]|uniref:Uncharacterized protein LOC116290940 isoform X1 n=1 Tax=Actinia tenebrosa TaxID=6105 RepID=A0A6P8HBX4_ACTTE|nr:uncharacterized protein LOC116290940 isoform X1 [Actinia tenebrosa]
MSTSHLLAVVLLTALLTSTLAADYMCRKDNIDQVRCSVRQGNRCIPKGWECDGTLDCSGGSDEYPCGYAPNYVYVYKYSGHLSFPHKDLNLKIKTTIKLIKIVNDFIIKFEDPVLTQSKNDYTNLLSDEEIAFWKKEMKFNFKDNGEIGNIYYDSDQPQDILNMKKGIVSLFQIKLETKKESMTHNYENVETDVTGKCRVRYRTEREVVPPLGNFQKMYKINVTRINDYTDCENRPRDLYQNMESIKCNEEPGYNIPKARMMTSCTFYIRQDKMSKQAVINSCESHERQEFNFRRKPGDSPFVMITVRKRLELEKMMVELHQTPKIWNSKSSILFSFDGLYQKDDKTSKEILNQVKATLDRLTQLVSEETKVWDLISAEAPSLYSKLIGQLKWNVDEATFRDIYQQYYNQDKYRIWLESALPFVGSDAAGEEIKDKIESKSISGMSAVKLLTRLGMVNRPTKGLCGNIMKLCQTSVVVSDATVHSSCWLAFGSLVHSYCKEKQTCPDMFIEAMKKEYDTNLHSQKHHMEVIKDNEKLVVALKTIGNSGQKRLLPQLMKIITTWDGHNAISIAAMEATRRMVLDVADQRKLQQGLRDIFVNRSFCPEVRIVAFQELIRTGPTRTDILMPLANTMRTEINPLMKQFVYTYLVTQSKLNCPAKKSRKASIDLLARTANLPRPDFETRYSFSKSFAMGGIPNIFTQAINVESVHTTLSGLPRYVKLKHYMTLLGHYMEHVEHKARQREIVPLLRNLFGPYGMMEEKTSLWDFIRGKRSADDDGFPEVYKRMKEMLDPSTTSELPFKTSLSSKMFGSEIAYLVLNDSHTFIQNLIKDGTIRVDKDWWSNSLKAGFRFNISANDILFDAMRKIPTSIGIPLKIKTNTAGIFSYGLYVDAKTTPMLNLLSLSNKPTDISANCRECYSLSTYSMTKTYIFYRDLKLGYVVHQNMSHRCPVPIEKLTLNGQPPSRKYTIGSIMSKKKYNFYDSSSAFYRFVKLGGEFKKYDKVKWQTPQVSVLPGFGVRTGGNSGGLQIPGLGQAQGGAGQGSGGPPPGWGPNAGAGQSSGGPPPGWGAAGGSGHQSSGGPPPGWGAAGGAGHQSSGGPPPGWGLNAGGGLRSGGTPPSLGPNVETVAASSGQQTYTPPSRCIEAWNDSMKVCFKTDNETGTQMWYEPNSRKIDEIQIKYQNITQENDEEFKYLLEFHVNGENDTKIAEYHMELNTTKPPQNQPQVWDPLSDGLANNFGGFSAKAYEKKQGEITYMACVKSAADVPGMRWDLGIRWGKTCQKHNINVSSVLNYENGNPNLNISFEWDHLPVMIERMTCPRKYFEEMQKKMLEQMRKMREQMEKMKKQMGSNAGMGASGGRPGSVGGGPGGGGGGGMGGGPGGIGGGPGGMGGGPGMGFGNGSAGFPGIGEIPCFTSLNFKLSLKNSTTLELAGTLMPQPVTYQLPFNGTKVFEKTKDVMLYGITETCNVLLSNEITTFDKRTYTYDQSKRCPHVLAKDCSKKDLFTVFMNKDNTNQKIYTLVIKDKKNKGHVFVIKPDMTVLHNGKLVQISEGAEVDFSKICRVFKRSSQLVIKCKAGVILEARGGDLKIKVTPWYFGYMCGMCGNFNWQSNDDFMAPQDFEKEANNETFGTSWLIPGEGCNSECKLVYRPDIQRPSGKLCVSRRPVTRCAPNCQPTRQSSAKRTYHCLDNGTDEAKKVEQQITDEKFDEILKAFKGKDKDMESQADDHVDCQCTCPASSP